MAATKKLSLAGASAALQAARNDPRQPTDVLRALPPGLSAADALVAADLALGLSSRIDLLAKDARELPDEVIAAVLNRAARLPDTVPVFLRAFFKGAPAATRAATWRAALEALRGIDTTYASGSAKLRAKLSALAADARALRAFQATATSCADVPMDLLALLMLDGSTASVAALKPHFTRALAANDDQLDDLATLASYAGKRPAVRKLCDAVATALAARNAASPALPLGARILGEPVEEFWFSTWLSSIERVPQDAPEVQWNISLDSRSVNGFSVSVLRLGAGHPSEARTRFDGSTLREDQLELGSCTPDELPGYITRAAEKLRVHWNLPEARSSVRCGVRGKKKERLIAWLFGD